MTKLWGNCKLYLKESIDEVKSQKVNMVQNIRNILGQIDISPISD